MKEGRATEEEAGREEATETAEEAAQRQRNMSQVNPGGQRVPTSHSSPPSSFLLPQRGLAETREDEEREAIVTEETEEVEEESEETEESEEEKEGVEEDEEEEESEAIEEEEVEVEETEETEEEELVAQETESVPKGAGPAAGCPDALRYSADTVVVAVQGAPEATVNARGNVVWAFVSRVKVHSAAGAPLPALSLRTQPEGWAAATSIAPA